MLQRTVESKRKLNVPGCASLTADGMLSNLKVLKMAGKTRLKYLGIYGLFGMTNLHIEEFKFLIGVDSVLPTTRKPRFFGSEHLRFTSDDDRAMDVEVCPICQRLELVYDCPSESCQKKQSASQSCRACTKCIARCIDCGFEEERVSVGWLAGIEAKIGLRQLLKLRQESRVYNVEFNMYEKGVNEKWREMWWKKGDTNLEGLIVNDAFQVTTIVEKLSPLWKDFKNYLKHKCKEMTVEDLIVQLRIEEDNKAAERRSKGNSTINGAHIVEDNQNNSKKRKKAGQRSNQPKKKFKGKCFNCGKTDHKSTDCRALKKDKKKNQAKMIESNKECDDLCAMFSECNLVGNPRE
ncbi:putative glucan endo-1,3-beta-glucosidase A-like [Capsicum annuum]|nr:putative glucan endo-1,3-beta-glucosidase A-like [Capsicum annuum]